MPWLGKARGEGELTLQKRGTDWESKAQGLEKAGVNMVNRRKAAPSPTPERGEGWCRRHTNRRLQKFTPATSVSESRWKKEHNPSGEREGEASSPRGRG